MPTLAVNAWFLDDGTQVATVEGLRKVVDILMEEGPARGLILFTAATVAAPACPKTTVWSPQNAAGEGQGDPLDRGVLTVEEEGVILLGAPVGSEEWGGRWLRRWRSRVVTQSQIQFGTDTENTIFALFWIDNPSK